jgi:hypothetical protein
MCSVFQEGSLSEASSRSWTLASTCRSCIFSPRSCGVNYFSKQSAIALAFSNVWNMETVNSGTALLASTLELISNLSDIKLNAKFWNHSQSQFLSRSEKFYLLHDIACGILLVSWVQCVRVNYIWESDIFVDYNIQQITTSIIFVSWCPYVTQKQTKCNTMPLLLVCTNQTENTLSYWLRLYPSNAVCTLVIMIPFCSQSVLVYSANCVKRIGWHVEECSVALLCN